MAKGENSSSSSSSSAVAWLLLASARLVLLVLELERVSKGAGLVGVRLAAPAARLVDEALRGLNSVAEMLSLGEPKGDGETGLLVAPITAIGEDTLGPEAVKEVMPVVERLDSVRFHGRGEALGDPEPITPGCCRGLALATVAEVGVDATRGEVGCCGVVNTALGSWPRLNEDEAEKGGREGVQGREEVERILAGRRDGD